MQVVLIDDNEIDIFVNQKLLETAGIGAKITTFLNPVSALEQIKHKEIDILIVDNQMPELSGFDFLKQVLESDVEPETKIVVLTATLRPELTDKYKALSNRIHLWEKPLNTDNLSALFK